MRAATLSAGDTVRVVAPSFSLGIISDDVRAIANERFAELGLHPTFGAHVEEMDAHSSSSIASRVADLHDAYKDSTVKAIFSVIGGYNCNQLLAHLDWELIANNPKPLIGYSDTTALQNAIYRKTGHISYSGPAYSTFGQKHYFDYTLAYFKRAVMSNEPYTIESSDIWTDDEWYIDQEDRLVYTNDGFHVVQTGSTEGRIVGGNLDTLCTLFGTPYMPSLADAVLFLEEDACKDLKEINRSFESLAQQPDFAKVRGIVLGRFQVASKMTSGLIHELFAVRPALSDMPVIANVDFGHTSPIATFPIGGRARISATNDMQEIVIM